MALTDFWEDEIRKAMRNTGIEPISSPVFGWSNIKKVLVVVEKKEDHYEVYGIRALASDEGMQKISVNQKARSPLELGHVMLGVAGDAANQYIEGYAIRDPYTTIDMLFTAQEEKTSNLPVVPTFQPTAYKQVHGSVIGYVCDIGFDASGKAAVRITDSPILISEGMLVKHVLITGMTESGKTTVAKRIVSEVRKMQKPVLIVTPEPQDWTSLGKYAMVNGKEFLDQAINIYSIQDSDERAEEIAKTLSTVVREYSSLEPTDSLRLLFVVDEAHILLDDPEHCRMLDRAARQLRKFGVGCVFISQFYYDFENRGIRGNAHTRIIMRTTWEKDMQNLKPFIPKNLAQMLGSLDSGYGIFKSVCRELGPMVNQPIVCKFLKSDEVLQPVSLQPSNASPIPKDIADLRRNTICEIIRQHPKITAEEVYARLSKTDLGTSMVTLYSDLEWLEQRGRITHFSGERGKRFYVAS